MSASDGFHDKTTTVDQIWQTDFTISKSLNRDGTISLPL